MYRVIGSASGKARRQRHTKREAVSALLELSNVAEEEMTFAADVEDVVVVNNEDVLDVCLEEHVADSVCSIAVGPDELNTESAMLESTTQTVLSGPKLYMKRFDTVSDEQLKYFTGFDRPLFLFLFNLFTAHETLEVMYSLQPIDQFLLMLIKIRHNQDYKMIGTDFCILPHYCKFVFASWITFVDTKLASLNFFETSRSVPSDYAVIIDCTEMPIAKSKNALIQQVTYSNYKSRNTFKVLVGVTEKGAVVFCSDCFGGSISDRQIVKDSGFLDEIHTGDIVLADKGFEISDLLQEKGAYINIPPFKHGIQLSPQDVLKTRVIARRRIIIERVNGLAKKNRILTAVMPVHEWQMASKIVKICFYLCNFRKCI